MKLTGKLRIGFAILGLMCARSPLRAEFINTFPSWNGSDYIFSFGETDTATYGQTITTNGTDVLLQDFSFLIRTDSPTPSNFQAYVMQWDSINSHATGPVLFQSGANSNPQGPDFVEIAVPAGVALAPNTEYVLFFNATFQFDGQSDAAWFASVSDVYAGGSFVFINNNSDFGLLTTNAWTTNWIGTGDLAFKARLNPVPEPASWVMLSTGIVLGLNHLRRKRLARA